MRSQDTICALATPAGEGAVGIVRLSGGRCIALLRLLCGKEQFQTRRMTGVRLRDPDRGELLDRVLVCVMRAPKSYTGEDVVEIHAHGGRLNMERLLAVFLRQGARMAEPGEFTRRAFEAGKMDLSQAEAVAEIISARSSTALRNAQALLRGELGQRVTEIVDRLVGLCARLEACIDFAEDEIDTEFSAEEQAREHSLAEQQVEALARTYEAGSTLDGIRVSIVGPVNVGKSSLFNRLLNSARALVSEQEGTTRDYLEAETWWGERRVVLVDTAGQRPHGGQQQVSALERAGLDLAGEVIEQSDLLLSVVDLTAEEPAAQVTHGRGEVLVVANKLDLASEESFQRLRDGLGHQVVATSALEGRGIERLKQAVLERHCGPDEEGVLVTRQRQWEALVHAGQALSEGRQAAELGLPPEVVVEHVREALASLREITGESSTEDVLDQVFSRFCIGK